MATAFGELVPHEFPQPAAGDRRPILRSRRLSAILQALTEAPNARLWGNVRGLLQPPVYSCTKAHPAYSKDSAGLIRQRESRSSILERNSLNVGDVLAVL